MIRHIVGWRLTDETAEQRDAAVRDIQQALESLVGVVPGLLDLRVERNALAIDGNSDLGLLAHFVGEDELRAYVVHPAHQAAVQIVRAHTRDRFAIDWVVAD